MPTLETPLARLELERHPHSGRLPLQAFDAADEYLLNQLAEGQLLTQQPRTLILNDSFGALACSLAPHTEVVSSGDSHLARLALEENLQRNGLAAARVHFVPADSLASGPFDLVLIRIPKTLALLEEQLIRLQAQLAPGARVIAAAMVKHLPRSAGTLLERYIGPVQASLAVKKARLLWVTPAERPRASSPYPTEYSLQEPPLRLLNHASLFAREGPDIGTRTLLPHLPTDPECIEVADLGCGNGILGIAYARLNPAARLTLVDESYMAVQSSRSNWQRAFGERPCDIRSGDGLADLPAGSLQRVLCNPPFHQQQAVGDFLAWRMFRQAHRALQPGGDLWIVGNRHLGYHVKLRQLFAQVEQIGANAKFVILRARR